MLRLISVALLIAFAIVAPASARSHHCGNLYRQTDVGPIDIYTRNVTCPSARRILRRWENDAAAPDSGPRAWNCRVSSTGRYSERHYCRRPHGVINFTLLAA